MALVLLHGDTGTHGGSVVSSATKTYAEGKKVVLHGDTYNCPLHGAQTVVALTTKTYAEGKLIAVEGGLTTTCWDTLSSSATKTEAE